MGRNGFFTGLLASTPAETKQKKTATEEDQVFSGHSALLVVALFNG